MHGPMNIKFRQFVYWASSDSVVK